MKVIYQPRGRALEYALLACNLYRGCASHCGYCYVPSASRMSRAAWEAIDPAPRKDIITLLERDAKEIAGTDQRVLLCFLCDPYQPVATTTGVTRRALEVLRAHDVPFQVLTKGGMRAAADFDLYGLNDAFATTLTTIGSEAWTWEPGAADPSDRIRAIGQAHKRGIETWVSLEPVIDPEWSLHIIRSTWDIVDLYKIGKLNHDSERAAKIDWRRFGSEAIALCEKHGVPYYIKDDLAKHLDGVKFSNTDTRRVYRSKAMS